MILKNIFGIYYTVFYWYIYAQTVFTIGLTALEKKRKKKKACARRLRAQCTYNIYIYDDYDGNQLSRAFAVSRALVIYFLFIIFFIVQQFPLFFIFPLFFFFFHT